jgi:NhaA family Na+:H+ antiporter
VLRPLQEFFSTETGGGILLLGATLAALAWSNSAFAGGYERLWHTRFTVGLGTWSIAEDLRHWVNDGLMTLFFFVVGLEMKRAFTTGELRTARAAALPLAAAVGGMVMPALIYLALNPTGTASRGWGIPMATDIAFALGVLALAGRGVPSALKTFLLALAIVDDIGAIVVIAVFYSAGIAWGSLAAAGGLVLVLVGLQRLRVRWTPLYVVLGVAVWLTTFDSGIHATLAGVVLGLITPSAPFQRPDAVSEEARRVADETVDRPWPPDTDAPSWLHLSEISREAVSPLARLEHLLHPWTSYLVVPVFALANAGVRLSGGALVEALSSRVTMGIVAGLVVGKSVGVAGTVWLATRLRLASLPVGVRREQMLGVSVVAGIGFTVSLFIAGLAFGNTAMEEPAKVGVLAGSLISGVVGAAILRFRGREGRTP